MTSTAHDRHTLAGHGIAYRTYGRSLASVAKGVYRCLETALGRAPTAAECEGPFTAVVQGLSPIQMLLARAAHLPPSFHPAICGMIARCVLDDDWAHISAP